MKNDVPTYPHHRAEFQRTRTSIVPAPWKMTQQATMCAGLIMTITADRLHVQIQQRLYLIRNFNVLYPNIQL